jgi:hypothetical protein
VRDGVVGYKAEIITLNVNVSDEVIARLLPGTSRDGTWPATYRHADIEAYRYRRTDVRDKVGLAPLSVSTDRIGIPAMRAGPSSLPSGHESH